MPFEDLENLTPHELARALADSQLRQLQLEEKLAGYEGQPAPQQQQDSQQAPEAAGETTYRVGNGQHITGAEARALAAELTNMPLQQAEQEIADLGLDFGTLTEIATVVDDPTTAELASDRHARASELEDETGEAA